MNSPQQSTVASKAVKNSAVISVFKTLGLASTLLIDIAIAAHFGFSQDTDAFFLAFTIPKLITSILLVSANSVLVPSFTKIMLQDGTEKLWRVVSNLTNIGLLALGALGLLGMLLSPLLMRLLGIALNTEARALATSLSVVLFVMVIPTGAVEVLTAALNALRSFGMPEATILLRNLVTLALVLLLSPRFGIYAVAIGYSAAAILQLAALGLVLGIGKRFRYHLSLDFAEEHTRFAIAQMRYPVVGSVFAQGGVVVERFAASFLTSGSISQLAYARRLYGALDSMFAGSISTAFLPRLSAQFSPGNLGNFRKSVALAIKMALFVAVPTALGVVVLSQPTVELLYGRGVVDQASLYMVAVLLRIFALAIPAMAVYRILQIAYYSFDDTKTPFRNSMYLLGLNIVIDLLLLVLGLGVLSFAAGYVISLSVATLYIFRLLKREIGGYEPDLAPFVAKIGVAAILMASLVLATNALIAWPKDLNVLIQLGTAVILGVVSYPLALLLLRVNEVTRIAKLLVARFHPLTTAKRNL